MNPASKTFHLSRSERFLFGDIEHDHEAQVESYQYSWMPAGMAPDTLIQECSALYSQHYGVWAEGGAAPAGRRIRLSAARLREWTSDELVSLALATWRGALIGYAIVLQAKVKDFGTVSWVTQFVVHGEHRARGVGQRLLFAAWGMSDHAAWGITTSNPYAVRALEKATRRRCSPERILRNHRRLQRVGIERVPYLNAGTCFEVSPGGSRVDTGFFVDHSGLDEKLRAVTAADKPWLLGELPAGWELFAFCFADQPQIRLTRSEIDGMLEAADEITREAYGRMTVSDHGWARHSGREADWILEYAGIHAGDAVLDLGCGIGRHAIALAARGCEAVGVEYSTELIDRARASARHEGSGQVAFVAGDCRTLSLGRLFPAVVCLYDVVGTYAEEESNLRLLETIRRHLVPGGRALLSVMNGTLTRQRATAFFSLDADPDRLLSLAASDTMQKSGDIFDPDYFLIETGSGVVYRKERFGAEGHLPSELIVRDRRFSVEEIVDLCRAAGLTVRWARPVRAGRWDEELPELHPNAKEILVLCERSTGG